MGMPNDIKKNHMKNDLKELELRRNEKFRNIILVIAGGLSFGEFEALADEQKTRFANEAEDAIDEWEEMIHMHVPPPEPTTPLQTLLRDYHEICGRIMDIHDEDVARRFHEGQ
jgi:hypothetical protein